MKKVLASLLVLLSCICLSGCSLTNDTAKDAVEEFLDQYTNLSASVLSGLEDVVLKEPISDSQKEVYRDVLKKQYSDLKYEILEEKYDGDTAVVTAKITVYDLYKAQNDASKYLNDHMDEFQDKDGKYNDDAYMDYKLDQMKKMNDKVEYTIEFNVSKNEDGKWKVEELSNTDLEKIHGIYNYDE